MDVLRRDLDVARDSQRALAERRDSLLVEQAGAVAGIFATDNATDRSISQQTTDRLALTLVELNAMMAERRARLPALQRQADREEQLLTLNQEGPIRVPAPSVIIRVLAHHGEVLRAGQEVAKLAACGEPILTAELDERSMRQVRVGQKAEFRPVGSREVLTGEVVQVIPVSLTPGEARGRPQALLRIASQAEACETGRMGEVRFLR
jgi:multidrug resistance efflux pump